MILVATVAARRSDERIPGSLDGDAVVTADVEDMELLVATAGRHVELIRP